MLLFTFGERKIWSNIKKSQNITTMIVGDFVLQKDEIVTSTSRVIN